MSRDRGLGSWEEVLGTYNFHLHPPNKSIQDAQEKEQEPESTRKYYIVGEQEAQDFIYRI